MMMTKMKMTIMTKHNNDYNDGDDDDEHEGYIMAIVVSIFTSLLSVVSSERRLRVLYIFCYNCNAWFPWNTQNI